MNVLSESNRWTNGKPRFKYGCPKRRGKEKCGFKSIDGNRLDDFVMEQLGKIAEQDSEYYTKILDCKMQSLIKNGSNERDLAEAKKRKYSPLLLRKSEICVKQTKQSKDISKMI